jgi:predicted porin
MKKSLIALAVMAAAGAASAQSSVTLFGIVDASLTVGRGSLTDRTQITDSGYNSSRLGFRGTEDLGGGMSASFWLEAGLNNDNGTGDPTNTNNQGVVASSGGTQGLTFNRRSTVSLAGGWGELRVGRDYVPAFWNLTVFDPFGTNGVGTTATASLAHATSVRASNSVGYFLPPNLGGFYGQAMYFLGENPQDGTAAQQAVEDDGRGYGLRVGYGSGPFNVAFGYTKTEYAGIPGTDADVTMMNIGGQWDFGVAKLLGQFVKDEVADVDSKGFLIGALVPVGAGEIRASYSQYRVDLTSAALGLDEPRVRKIALGYVHNLSKRTAVYATVARARNSGGSAVALGGATTAANSSSTGFDLGLRHSF